MVVRQLLAGVLTRGDAAAVAVLGDGPEGGQAFGCTGARPHGGVEGPAIALQCDVDERRGAAGDRQ
jgi:hypothetical protein